MEENEIRALVDAEVAKAVTNRAREMVSDLERVTTAAILLPVVESQIDKELTLITARTGWMLTSQAIIFTFYGILVTADADKLNARFPGAAEFLESWIPFVALALIAIVFFAILAAITMLIQLHAVRASTIEFINTKTSPMQLPKLLECGNLRWQAWVGIAAPLLISAVLAMSWFGVNSHVQRIVSGTSNATNPPTAPAVNSTMPTTGSTTPAIR